jgi:surface polysaccharide O-acyltransferase-like enzyme
LWLSLIASGLLIAVGTGALLPVVGQRSWKIMYTYLNPIVIIMSLCIFLIFMKQNIALLIHPGLLQRIATVSLGVYVIHPLWLWVLGKFKISPFLIHPLIGIPITTLLAFTLSLASASLMARVPVLKRTVC